MECKVWEEKGMLYSSNELSERERAEFSEHLKSCSECSRELEVYYHEKEHLFSGDVFTDSPSAACDAEILRVCSDGRKRVSNANPLPLFFKRAFVSVSFLLVGFVAVGYFTLKTEAPNRRMTVGATSDPAPMVDTPVAPVSETLQALVDEKTDSTESDSSRKNSVNFANTRGNLGVRGVVPVDLQNK